MNASQTVILIVVIVIILALVALAVVSTRRRALRQRFGPEYDRVLAEQDSRSAAEHELRERERKHAELDLKPLSAQSRTQYAAEWAEVQTQFLDSPQDAVRAGDDLVTRLVREIGYPTESYDEQVATLSVEHAQTLGHYRDAHDVFLSNERGEASTEQLRQALVHYRALFAELLGDQPVPPTTAPRSTVDPQSTPEPQSTPDSRSAVAPQSTPDPESTPEPESTVDPESTPEPRSMPEPRAAEPESESAESAESQTRAPEPVAQGAPASAAPRTTTTSRTPSADGPRPDPNTR
jgi:hypothetical protein